MRIALGALLVVVTAACGDLASSQALSPAAAASASPSAAATASPTASPKPRPTSAATLDCTVSWRRSYRTLGALVDDSDLIARATFTARDEVQLKVFGTGNAVSYRSARRTTLAVRATLSRGGAAPTEVRVIEDVCPGLDATPGDEWVLFLRKGDARYGPDDGGDHYYALGGPQGIMRIRAGVVAGPFFKFQRAVHAYEGATLAEVERDLAAITPLDRAAARTLVERHSWRILADTGTRDDELPADPSHAFWSADTPRRVFDEASARIGLDLATAAPGPVRIVGLLLEADRPSTEKQYQASVAYDVDGRIVGAWVTAGIPWTWTIFGLDQRDEAIELGGRF